MRIGMRARIQRINYSWVKRAQSEPHSEDFRARSRCPNRCRHQRHEGVLRTCFRRGAHHLRRGPPRALQIGQQKINLHPFTNTYTPKAQHPTCGSADLCFLSGTALATWLEHLAACGIAVIAGPVPRTGATGPIESIYLRDPDGNLIEIANLIYS